MEEEKMIPGMSMVMDMCVALAIKAKIKPADFVKAYSIGSKEMLEYKKEMIKIGLDLVKNNIK